MEIDGNQSSLPHKLQAAINYWLDDKEIRSMVIRFDLKEKFHFKAQVKFAH